MISPVGSWTTSKIASGLPGDVRRQDDVALDLALDAADVVRLRAGARRRFGFRLLLLRAGRLLALRLRAAAPRPRAPGARAPRRRAAARVLAASSFGFLLLGLLLLGFLLLALLLLARACLFALASSLPLRPWPSARSRRRADRVSRPSARAWARPSWAAARGGLGRGLRRRRLGLGRRLRLRRGLRLGVARRRFRRGLGGRDFGGGA